MQPCLNDNQTNTLRKEINNCWKNVYHFLGKDNLKNSKKLNDDLFLLFHTLAYFDNISEKISDNAIRFLDGGFTGQIEKISDYLLKKEFITKNINNDGRITIKSINEYAHSIMDYAIVWYNYWNYSLTNYTDELKLCIGRINRIISSNRTTSMVYILPFVLNRLVKYNDRQELLKDFLIDLERFLALINILRFPYDVMDDDDKKRYRDIPIYNTKDDITVNIVNINITIDILKKYLPNITINLNDAKFKYGDENINYIMFEYEQYLQSKSLNKTSKIDWVEYCNYYDNASTIEHIYPQRPKDKYWKDRFKMLTKNEQDILSNSIGNLLPLSKPKNSSLQNNPFPDKKVSKKGYVGYFNGSYAEMEVAQEDEWTPKQIINRGIRLLDLIEIRWQIKLGNMNDKIKLLGLEEICKKIEKCC